MLMIFLPWKRKEGVISSVRISDVSFQLSSWASSSGTRGAITIETERLFRNRRTEELGEKYGVEWGNAVPISTI